MGSSIGRAAVLVAVAISVSSGCASRADLERIRRDQQEMRARLADVQVALDSVNRRLDTMRSSIDERGGSRDSATVRALERRIAELESRSTQPTATPGEPGTLTTPGPVERPVANVPRTEAAVLALRREDRQPAGTTNETYRRALQAYRDGQADQAIQLFREFVRANPKSDQADNAQYWIGEAYYSKNDYNRSIIEFNEVLLKYPQGDQVPGALLALATSFASSGDKIDAKLILQKLISDHPRSEEAEVGRRQLQSLGD